MKRLFSKPILLLILLVALAQAARAAESESILSLDFEGENPLSAFESSASFATLAPGLGQGKALSIQLKEVIENESGMLRVGLDVNRIAGKAILISGQIKGEEIASTKANATSLGAKMMLYFTGEHGSAWENIRSAGGTYGTFDWKREAYVVHIPSSVTEAWLMLGLQGCQGRVLFDDIQIRTIPREADEREYVPQEGPAYKGHSLPRLRGAMMDMQPKELDVRDIGTDWGANLIRYQMNYGIYKRTHPDVSPEDLIAYDEWLAEEVQHVDKTLELCKESGMMMVLDLHSAPGGCENLFAGKVYQDKLVEVWEMLAEKYKGNPTIWGYDILNEPVEDKWNPEAEGVQDWQGLVERVAAAIRAIDGERTLIVGASDWSNPAGFAYLKPIPQANVIYQVHMYYPHKFTHQGVNGSPEGFSYPGEIGNEFWDKERLRKSLKPVIDFQKEYNVHIYVGEFSAIRWAPDNSAFRYMRECIELFEEYGWDWSFHAFREWDGWSVEHGTDKANREKASPPTDREQLIRAWWEQNYNPVTGKKKMDAE